MKKFRGLLLGSLTLAVAATAAGCGTNALPTALHSNAARVAQGTITAHGVTHKLGYDLNRYERVLAPKSHKRHLIRQGLRADHVDSREFCSPIADQGKLGSCTAFAMGKGLREFIQNKNHERAVPLSPLFLYYEERVMMGTVGYDSGATITDGMTVLSDTGIATEDTWAYDIAQFKIKPSKEAYASAGEFKVHDATELATFDDVKTALAKGQSVAFGFRVYESFRKIGADGVMPVPASGERLLGGHAVLAVGYDDSKKSLIVRNSWGPKWGDHGYFYMPYEVADSWAARDFWTASK